MGKKDKVESVKSSCQQILRKRRIVQPGRPNSLETKAFVLFCYLVHSMLSLDDRAADFKIFYQAPKIEEAFNTLTDHNDYFGQSRKARIMCSTSYNCLYYFVKFMFGI